MTAPTPDPTTESWLATFGVTNFELTRIPLARWNRERSLHNQARLTDTPLTDEVVINYALALETGAAFPPVLVVQDSSGYITIDGNHRLAAAQLVELPELAAYVLRDLTEPQKLMLTFDANTRHGLRTTTQERIAQAVTLVAQGVSQTEAARTLNVERGTLGQHVAANGTRTELAAEGVDVSRLSTGYTARIANLRSRPVRLAMANWVNTSGMNVTEVSEHVTRLNDLDSEHRQLTYINRESTLRAALNTATANGRINLPPPLQHLNSAINAVNEISLRAMQSPTIAERTTEESRTILASRTLDAIAKLRRIATALTSR